MRSEMLSIFMSNLGSVAKTSMSNIIETFYEQYNEDGRMARREIEFARSKEIISRYLSGDNMAIADIGGASGAYSFWLASLGHRVHLLDFTRRHIEQAKAKAESTGVHLSGYHCADARDLPFDSDFFDMVLLMGPLYHLQLRDDRLKCLRESRRILKKGGVVICAIISRYASMLDGFKYGLIKDENFKSILKRDIETGCHDNPHNIEGYFTTAYLHTPDEIKSELEDSGFTDVRLIAVEGFANMFTAENLPEDPEVASCMLEYIKRTEETYELLGLSDHILAIGIK